MASTKTVELSGGRKIGIDMHKITIREYRELFSNEQANEEADATVGKCCGLTGEEVGSLPFDDYRRLMDAFWAAAKNPLETPN